MLTYAAIAIFGVLGCWARYAMTQLVQGLIGEDFPYATLIINVLGSFLLGLIVFSLAPDDLLYFGGIGIMGGFTTFSTFSYETFRMLEDRDYYTMILNILTNGGCSILGVMGARALCMALGIHG